MNPRRIREVDWQAVEVVAACIAAAISVWLILEVV